MNWWGMPRYSPPPPKNNAIRKHSNGMELSVLLFNGFNIAAQIKDKIVDLNCWHLELFYNVFFV